METSSQEGVQIESQHPFNGYDDEGNLWAFGKKVSILKRKPRVTKAGSASRKDHLPAKQADNRQSIGTVGSSMNTEHTGDMESRPVERIVIKKEK